MFKLIFLGLLMLAIGVGIGAYTISNQGGAGGIGPDSIFYTLDTGWEWVELHVLTWDSASRAEVRLRQAKERVEELSDPGLLRSFTQEHIERLKKSVAADVKEIVAELEQKAKDETSDRISGLFDDAKQFLGSFVENANH